MSPRRYVVLDTSVLLAVGPVVLESYGDAEVVLSSVVLDELEGKRHLPDELGHQARQCLRYLDTLLIAAEAAGHADGPYALNHEGGVLTFEMNHRDQAALPETMRDQTSNDKRILSIAKALADEHPDAEVTVVSRDLPMRLHARLGLHLKADSYTLNHATGATPSGITTLDLGRHIIDQLHDTRGNPSLDLSGHDEVKALPLNTGVILGGALARVTAPGVLRKVNTKQPAFGFVGRSAEQHIALAHLFDPEIKIVSLGGRAGTGKTATAMAAGLQQTMEDGRFKKIMVFRNMHAVGEQDLGYLPGTAEEKLGPWAQAVEDVLGGLCSAEVRQHILERELLEVLPLTHIRGRTFHDSYVIVDEAQNLELSVLSTVMTRLAESSKIVLTHDMAQRDNLHVNRYDGVAVVIERLLGSPLFAHTTLVRSERSRAAELVSNLLDVG